MANLQLSLLSLLFGSIFVASVIARSSSSGTFKLANGEVVPFIEDENFFYFYDITNRNRSQALDFCQSASANGELGIITGPMIYDRLRLGEFPPTGTYWINGGERQDVGRFSNVDVKCEDNRGLWSLNDVPVTVAVNYCLVLHKPANVANSVITAADCKTATYRTLCSLPLNACRNPATTTTTPATSAP